MLSGFGGEARFSQSRLLSNVTWADFSCTRIGSVRLPEASFCAFIGSTMEAEDGEAGYSYAYLLFQGLV